MERSLKGDECCLEKSPHPGRPATSSAEPERVGPDLTNPTGPRSSEPYGSTTDKDDTQEEREKKKGIPLPSLWP